MMDDEETGCQAGTKSSGGIQSLDKLTSSTIRNCQIIRSPFDVVRELVENSIDAGGETLQILLEKYGVDKIEVRDNGHGLIREDIEKICKGGYTSKLQDTRSLSRGSYFGFKGEAIGAICASGNVTITTKTAGEVAARRYQLNHQGSIISSLDARVAHNVGTTITLEKLFEHIPVRRQRLVNKKTATNDLEEIKAYLKGVALAHPKTHISLIHDTSLVWSKAKVQTLDQALFAVFGHGIASKMRRHGPVEIETVQEVSGTISGNNNNSIGCSRTLELFLPKNPVDMRTMSFTSNKLSMIFCNKKRVYIREFEKLIHRYVTAVVDKPQPADQRRFPICAVFITVPPKEVDFNRDMDKTKVFLIDKDKIFETIEDSLSSFYGINLRTRDDDNGDVDPVKVSSSIRTSAIQTTVATAAPKPPVVPPQSVSAGQRRNTISTFLEDMPSTSVAFSNSPSKAKGSEPTTVNFPPGKPAIEVPLERIENATTPSGGEAKKTCDQKDVTVAAVVSNFDIDIDSLFSQSQPDEEILVPVQNRNAPEIPATAATESDKQKEPPLTGRYEQWLTGRLLDNSGAVVENVVAVTTPRPSPETSSSSAEASMERFRQALMAGVKTKSVNSPYTPKLLPPAGLTTSRSSTPKPSSLEPPAKRQKQMSAASKIPAASPTSVLTSIPSPTLPSNSQLRLDALTKWPVLPVDGFGAHQIGFEGAAGVRTPKKMGKIQQDFAKSLSLQTPPMVLPAESSTFNQWKIWDSPALKQYGEDLITQRFTPSLLSQLPQPVDGSIGHLYVAVSKDGIGVFSPLNFLNSLPIDERLAKHRHTAPDENAAELFAEFISHPDLQYVSAGAGGIIFKNLKDVSGLQRDMCL